LLTKDLQGLLEPVAFSKESSWINTTFTSS
jgi:hypothetical protein